MDVFGNRVFSIKMRGFEIAKDPEVYSEPCQTSKMDCLTGLSNIWLTGLARIG